MGYDYKETCEILLKWMVNNNWTEIVLDFDEEMFIIEGETFD